MSETASSNRYRAEIDGLRTIAVGGVVLFHAGFSLFRGGFVGVDVFFVISGYLITGILLRDSSILNFYQRRARRILPALLAMIAVVLVVGLLLLLPDDLMKMSKSIIATCTFVSNIFFWRQAGYFKPEVELMPMLHTWSLGVEEQFYIFFPLLIILMKKLMGPDIPARRYAWIFGVLLVASLALAVYAIGFGQAQTAFYLLPTRAWELLVGSLLATQALPVIRSSLQRNVLSLAGLAAVVVPIFVYDRYTPFPGLAAIPPVVGTAAIIYASTHGGNVVARMLSVRPMVFVGLISYSLYLWHWPVIAFLRYRLVRDPTALEALLAVSLAFLLGYISWAYVERPFRKGFSDRAIWKISGMSLGGAMAVAAIPLMLGGLPSRFPAKAVALNEQTLVTWRCPVNQMSTLATGRVCDLGLQGASPQDADTVLWGDSHAQMYGPAFQLATMGHPAIIAHVYGCAPVMRDDSCGGRQVALFEALLASRAKVVLMAQNWAGAAGDDGEPKNASPAQRQANYARAADALARTVAALRARGKKVVLIAPIPRPGFSVPSVYSRELVFFGRFVHPQGEPLPAFRHEYAPVLAVMQQLAAQDPGVRVIHIDRMLCADGLCRYVNDKGAVFADLGHLETGFVKTLAPLFGDSLASAPKVGRDKAL